MTASECNGCKRVTGHKRSIGIGTLIIALLTFGFSLFTIPFYPKRCVICGLADGAKAVVRTPAAKSNAQALFLLGLVLVFVCMGVFILSH
jgi:hypothetical protein